MARFFIDRPIFAWVIALFILVLGGVSITQLPISQYPPVAPPSIVVTVAYPGASAQTLEDSVLAVIEREMNGSPGMIYMESVSQANGTGTLTLSFQPGTNAELAQVDVQNRLSRATPRLPSVVTQQGVRVDKGHIVVDEWCRTGVPGLYAIGDVTGPPWLAHKASHEGIICVEKIAGVDSVHPLDKTAIPSCTYSNPQVASVGLTEEAALEAGHDLKVGRFPFSANGRARCMNETTGFVKIVADAKSDRMLGCHIFGARAGDLIAELVAVSAFRGSAEDIALTVHAHPTLAEAVKEAALDVHGEVLHI